jgi:hypothetical protein
MAGSDGGAISGSPDEAVHDLRSCHEEIPNGMRNRTVILLKWDAGERRGDVKQRR